ncbi:hypothetical protein IGM_00289 [Bacillus cereus HuB4-4]|uniref:Uncharacterized protein n=4 Tax=Bacillus cereus group TaxID=86661 RepID=A0A9W5QZW5_BACCE|nr:hypothetical protein IGM_00289 [Bacillus cereus HuB4-4]
MKYIVDLLITNQIQRGLSENAVQDAGCIDRELGDREKGKYLKFNKIILLIESEVRRMKALKKRKIRKAIARRAKDVEKFQVNKAWRNIFVQAGILK